MKSVYMSYPLPEFKKYKTRQYSYQHQSSCTPPLYIVPVLSLCIFFRKKVKYFDPTLDNFLQHSRRRACSSVELRKHPPLWETKAKNKPFEIYNNTLAHFRYTSFQLASLTISSMDKYGTPSLHPTEKVGVTTKQIQRTSQHPFKNSWQWSITDPVSTIFAHLKPVPIQSRSRSFESTCFTAVFSSDLTASTNVLLKPNYNKWYY